MNRFYKRLFDFMLSLFLLILLSPILVLTYIMVCIFLGYPSIFKQERPGKGGKNFVLYKFRSMTSKKDINGKLLPDKERLNKFGKFIRKTSIDELPELWNILKGDMSFVGPRPLLVQYMDRYNSRQLKRHDVRPGLTGWAQVNGRNSIDWAEKFELDVWYVENQSLLLDIKILFKTFVVVFCRSGINAEGEATMSEFMGNEED